MSRRLSAVILVFVLTLAPLANFASAHPDIGVSTDISHVILSPGQTTNVTLTVDNDGDSIESYEINITDYDSVWEIIPSSNNLSSVIPTGSASATIVVRLSTDALPSNSGSMNITVTEPDAGISSSIIVYLSVQAVYLPAIDTSFTGDNGLVEIEPGQDSNLSIMVQNSGNVDDTILLSVDQSPDLVGFWANWTSGGNNSNNNSGNGTGNNTGGNNTGNGTGNNTGGNNTGGNGSNNGSMMMSGPVGWQVRFTDDTMDMMAAHEIRYATLRITIPSNEVPGYYGFDLYAASALGNFSVKSTLVVEVTATHDLEFSITNGIDLLPGANTSSEVEITSLSTADGNWTWTASTESMGCSVELDQYQTTIMMGSTSTLNVITTVGPNNNVGDECQIELQGTLDSDSTITETYQFTVYVGENWGLSMVIPTSIKLDVDTYETFNIAISNDGTEEDTISLIGIDQEGITFDNPEPVSLDRGQSQYVSVGVTVDSSIVGNITLQFYMSSTNSGIEGVFANGTFEVKPFSMLSVSGPQDNRLIIAPGSNSSITLNITNLGTRTLELTPSVIGLPSGVSILSGLDSLTIDSGETVDVVLLVGAATSSVQSSSMFEVKFTSSWTEASIELELQIVDRKEVSIDSTKNKIYASPIEDSNITLIITNLGTTGDNFIIDVDTSEVSDWFSIGISTLSMNLDSGESGIVELSVRETATGAPLGGTDLLISVVSVNDYSISDDFTLEIIPQVSDGMLTIASNVDSGEPGENIRGTIIITNMGTSYDTLSLTTVELDCTLSKTNVSLEPSMSSAPIDWSCTIPEDANAGVYALTFRLTSAARSNMIITGVEGYDVEPVWGDTAVEFEIENANLVFDKNNEQQTISLTICNIANTYIQGSLELVGKNEPQMDGVFYRAGETGINATYSLSSGGCQDFRLMLTPLNMDGFDANLNIHAISQIDGKTIRDESQQLRMAVSGPHVPPDGINLGFLELDNKNSMIILASGWALAALLLLYIKLFRKPVEIEAEEEIEEEIPLGPNEVRIDEYNKVTCTSCESRLGVPQDSEPPFRFTCPKCQTRIRVVE